MCWNSTWHSMPWPSSDSLHVALNGALRSKAPVPGTGAFSRAAPAFSYLRRLDEQASSFYEILISGSLYWACRAGGRPVAWNNQKACMSICSVQKAISVGVAVENDRYCLAVCEGGSGIRRREFAVDASGQLSLASFVAGFNMPARIAIGASTAAIALAVALSAIPQSEIFLVAPSIASQSVQLVRYAERSI